MLLHRASMKFYESYLLENGIDVEYIESIDYKNDVREYFKSIDDKNVCISYYDVCDNWLDSRIQTSCKQLNIAINELITPLFLNSKSDLNEYFGIGRKKYIHNDFYILQRKRFGILIDHQGKPKGGKWSFDQENRLKYPKGVFPPKIEKIGINPFYQEAYNYVNQNFSENVGQIDLSFQYPSTHKESEKWLTDFLVSRFEDFGNYEDAILVDEVFNHHSVLTPILNIGLITPQKVIQTVIEFSEIHNISMNSVEGFIRQIIGWREFIRGIYVYHGSKQRTTNFWGFNRKIPKTFYSGETGIEPIDKTILKLIKTGYNHHIERLMILGNFMLLSEISPDEVYRWFMEFYIDSYDWVMVPNIYGMSQFSDGGLMATKPYISGSSYVLKMSNYTKGDWTKIWDSLFWRFLSNQRQFFSSNPRLGMLLKTYDKMTDEKKENIAAISTEFLKNLSV